MQRLFSPEPTAGHEPETTPKKRSLRPLGGGGGVDSNTWYPSTPDRQVHRKRSSLGRSTLSTTSTTDSETASATRASPDESESSGGMNMASIRGMDKLEIFFK